MFQVCYAFPPFPWTANEINWKRAVKCQTKQELLIKGAKEWSIVSVIIQSGVFGNDSQWQYICAFVCVAHILV